MHRDKPLGMNNTITAKRNVGEYWAPSRQALSPPKDTLGLHALQEAEN